MIDIARVKARLKQHEGYSSIPYRCSGGHRTIGWGYNLDAHTLPADIKIYLDNNGMIAPSHAERLLNITVQESLDGCRFVWPEFDEFPIMVQEALVDFVFNLGTDGAANFVKACAAIDAKDWATAAEEMTDSKWHAQVGQRADEIVEMIRSAS